MVVLRLQIDKKHWFFLWELTKKNPRKLLNLQGLTILLSGERGNTETTTMA